MTNVSGYLYNAQGTPLPSRKVVFTPLSTPAIEAVNLQVVIASNLIEATSTNSGYFEMALKKGDYRVTIDDADVFHIAVVTDSGSVAIGSIVTENLFYIPVTVHETQRLYTPVTDGQVNGAVNGVNATFTVEFQYVTGSLRVYRNGVRQKLGADNDFQESGDRSFTLATPLLTEETLVVDYLK